MRLTSELINGSLSYLNPLNERELDLRGHKIPTIENLGVAGEQESIDFTDNDITTLANFPLSVRLRTLLCARNRINSLQASLAERIPNLTTLVLTQNNLAELADLDPLKGFKKLTHLSLLENPVTSKENYRYFVLYLCPHVRFLDFQKVKDAERARAKELFGTLEEPTELAQNVAAVRSHRPLAASGAVNGAGSGKGQKMKITEKERKKFEVLVKKATSLAEVQRLEKMLSEGRLPPGVMDDDDAMDET